MAEVSREQVEQVLSSIMDINLGKDLMSAGDLKQLDISGDRISVSLELGYPCNGYKDELSSQVQGALREATGLTDIQTDITFRITSHVVQKGVHTLANVKNTIAVASGKGGVGKSTTAVNLALALQAEGASVGILDADIYGPSQPRMLGCGRKPDSPDGKTIEPNVSYDIQSMSIGYLIDEETPMIWRGPMVTSALEQLLNDTNWRDLDYLVIDLPPGTGDIQLTLCQKVPLTGALIVTTPQDIALLDARKGLKMFEKVEVPVLGIIENMSRWPASMALICWGSCRWTSKSGKASTTANRPWSWSRTRPLPGFTGRSPAGRRPGWRCGPRTTPVNSRRSWSRMTDEFKATSY